MKKVTATDKLSYAGLTLLLGVAAAFLGQTVIELLPNFPGMALLTGVLVGWLWEAAIMVIFIRRKPESHYEEGASPVRAAISMMLPGEVVRFLISVLPFSPFCFGAGFGFFSQTLFFEYCQLARRYDAVISLAFIGSDYVVYALCYLLTAAPFCLTVIWGYRHFWNRYIEREALRISEEELTARENEKRTARRRQKYEAKKEHAAVREFLMSAFWVLAAVTVVGTISNALLLLIGYLFSFPVTKMAATAGRKRCIRCGTVLARNK